MRQLAQLAGSPHRLALSWLLLALGSLGLSALFAIALVVARTPLFGLGGGTFRTALVLHVDLAVVVWFLAMASAIWVLAVGRAGLVGWVGLGLAALGVVTMVVSPPLIGGIPVLANYVPLLDSVAYFGAMAAFAVGVLLAAGRALLTRPQLEGEPWRLAAWLAALVALIAAAQLLWAFGPATGSQSLLTLDDRLWPAGHTLQYVHVLLLMATWSILGERQSISRGLLPALMVVAALPALASLGATFLYPMGSVEQRVVFTTLMRWTSWPPAVVYGLVLLKGLMGRPAFWREPESAALLLSILLFFIGCLLGATIRGESTAVPAHYHGTVGAVTLAYLAWSRRLLPALGFPADERRLVSWLPVLYGLGIALLVAGLGWWGGQDIPRKVAHAELLAQGVPYFLAMGLAGLGGLLALGAVLTHVGLLLQRLAKLPKSDGRVDVRPFALGLTLLLVVVGGWLLGGVDGKLYRGSSMAGHVAERKGVEIEARFQQGVIMLHARQYEYALAAFHRVLELAPEMPEAHVNIGYALLGMRKYAAARDFFDAATELRSDQINAYYGLAVALEGTGDVAGALGAMRTYLHRTGPDDPYRRKAEAAVWEWEEKLKLQREKK